MTEYLLLFGVGSIAGTINVLAGGGSLIALPVLIFLGLPATVANGTNRVAILAQNVFATWGFHRRGKLDTRWLKPALVPTLAGALAGAWAGTVIGDVAFQRVLAVLMLVIAGWMVWNPVAPRSTTDGGAPDHGPLGRALLSLAWIGVGFYGGFVQAGLGFVVLAVVSAAGLDLVRGNALKVALVLAFTPFALAVYAWDGLVDWRLGAALAVGNVAGARLGVHLTVLKGQRWLRPVVTVLVVLFAVRLWMA